MAGLFVEPDRIWCEIRAPRRPSWSGALFLDRDGTVIEERDYLADPAGVALIPGAAETIRACNKAGIAAILVTNQSGIARGRFGWREFAAVQDEMHRRLAAKGARLDAVYACPFHPAGQPPYRHPEHPDRKPSPGMVLRGLDAFAAPPRRAWIVGDKADDLAAGRAAGLACGALVATGHGGEAAEAAAALACDGFTALALGSIADLLWRVPSIPKG